MNKLLFKLKHFTKTLLRIGFNVICNNESCVVCGAKTYLYPVCKVCLKEKFNCEHLLALPRCKVCGKELISTTETCLQCREKPVLLHTNLVLPIFSYRLWNKELMFMWKTLEIRSLSDLFANFVFKALKELKIEYIVPVPPRPGKIKAKGWDQIDEICSLLKYEYGFKVLPILERKNTEQQKKLDRNDRLESIGKSYFPVSETKLEKILNSCNGIPEKVCIIDDVCTTGATLENCAIILKEKGVKWVSAVTLFIVET